MPPVDGGQAPATPSNAGAGDQPPATPGDNAPAIPPKQDYSALVNNVGEDAINQMMNQYDQVTSLLSDPERLKELSKDQVMQLYQARDGLQDKLSEILPVLEQGKNAKLEEVIKDIEDPGVKEYIMGFKNEFDDPEEFGALVEFAKGLLALKS